MRVPSMFQQTNQQEHARLRTHLQTFFTKENIDATYTTLHNAVVCRLERELKNNGCTSGSAKAGATIDAFALGYEIFDSMVLDVRSPLIGMALLCALALTQLVSFVPTVLIVRPCTCRLCRSSSNQNARSALHN